MTDQSKGASMSDLRKAAEMALEALDCLPWQASPIAVEATKALRQALAQPEQEPVGWMPIDSAPKGRIILVYYKNLQIKAFTIFGNGRIMRARYYLPETLESDSTESGWADEGWYEASEAYEYLMPLEHEPTHWMPLPAAPVDTVNISKERVDETAKRGHERWPDAPDEIYLQVCDDEVCDLSFHAHEVSWCEDMINDSDIKYVRADAKPAPTCPPCNQDCNQGRDCPARKDSP